MFIMISPIFDKVCHNSKILDALLKVLLEKIFWSEEQHYLLKILITKVL